MWSSHWRRISTTCAIPPAAQRIRFERGLPPGRPETYETPEIRKCLSVCVCVCVSAAWAAWHRSSPMTVRRVCHAQNSLFPDDSTIAFQRAREFNSRTDGWAVVVANYNPTTPTIVARALRRTVVMRRGHDFIQVELRGEMRCRLAERSADEPRCNAACCGCWPRDRTAVSIALRSRTQHAHVRMILESFRCDHIVFLNLSLVFVCLLVCRFGNEMSPNYKPLRIVDRAMMIRYRLRFLLLLLLFARLLSLRMPHPQRRKPAQLSRQEQLETLLCQVRAGLDRLVTTSFDVV